MLFLAGFLGKIVPFGRYHFCRNFSGLTFKKSKKYIIITITIKFQVIARFDDDVIAVCEHPGLFV